MMMMILFDSSKDVTNITIAIAITIIIIITICIGQLTLHT